MSSALPAQALQHDANARVSNVQSKLTTLQQRAGAQPQKLQEGVQEFASIFLLQMLQSMRRAVPQSGLLGKGLAHETYTSMFDQEVARQAARRETLGLTALLQRQTTARTDGQRAPAQTISLGPESAAASVGGQVPSPPRAGVLDAYRQRGQTAGGFAMPVQGRLTSDFGMREHPIDGEHKWHHGIDIAAPEGSPVRAAAAGEVIFSGVQRGYGNLVVLEHQGGYTTSYAHNAENLVPVGTQVGRGQPIATVGQTGSATGPHVHFEVRKDGERLDPEPLLYGRQ
jgi:murein DD-endopeptidase MepM/ murein hydrolase activator NlpD